MTERDCVFCDLQGCGVIIPLAHRLSPFDFTPEEWAATHEVLLDAKAAPDERLAPGSFGPEAQATTR
jgi:histidine triad (HIT) family protein